MPNTHRIDLSGELGLRDVHAVRELLAEGLGVHPAIEVHTGALSAIDVSIIQLLIAAHKSARERGASFKVRATADGPFRDTLLRAGLLLASGEAPFEINWHRRDAAQ